MTADGERLTATALRLLKRGPKGVQKKKAIPRQDSPAALDPRNRTSFHEGQERWSWDNLPDILYQMNPTGKEGQGREEDPGKLAHEIHGKRLRCLSVLPDNISSTVEEFRVEAWQRLDPRVTLTDITDRMHPDFRIKNNALQQRGVRFRQAFNLLAWYSGNKRSAQLEDELFRKMKKAGLDTSSNSTRGITPGLVYPHLGAASKRIPMPKSWAIRKLGPRSQKIRPSQLARWLEQLDEAEEDTCSAVSETPAETFLPTSLPTTPLPTTPDVSDHDAKFTELIHEFVPYDEYHNHTDGALPVIRGVNPDEDLPSTVRMSELDLLQGYRQPEPEIKEDNESLPLYSNPDRLAHRAPFWSPSSACSIRGFCMSPCFQDFPQMFKDFLEPTMLVSSPRSKPQTPTNGVFPLINPVQLNMIPAEQQKNVFDDMLSEYSKGDRELSEMPYYVAHSS
ncbi:hypothetical protein BJY04DRAFT_216613 [Aspergillus karnatakaensis]|uniref:uncharacterized protein n=1 Tax=Aspergillus karnatakaensis TaxID=1810916 RepID=UPI003CCE3F49